MLAAMQPLTRFAHAATEWAAVGGSAELVAAAATALADGVDSATLRRLAGVPRFAIDDEVPQLAPRVFEELGLRIAERDSQAAFVDLARLRAAQFVGFGGDPRALVAVIEGLWFSAGCPDQLRGFSDLVSWYDIVDDVRAGAVAEVDAAVRDAAAALAAGHPVGPIMLGEEIGPTNGPLRDGLGAGSRSLPLRDRV